MVSLKNYTVLLIATYFVVTSYGQDTIKYPGLTYLENELLTGLRKRDVDSALIFRVGPFGYSGNDTSRRSLLLWKDKGRSYGLKISGPGPLPPSRKVDNLLIDYFFTNHLNSNWDHRLDKFYKKRSIGWINPLDICYSLSFFHNDKHFSLLFSQDEYETRDGAFGKQFQKEQTWFEKLNTELTQERSQE